MSRAQKIRSGLAGHSYALRLLQYVATRHIALRSIITTNSAAETNFRMSERYKSAAY